MSLPYLSVEGLVQRFGGIVAVDELSFSVTSGEMFGVFGPNGAGKTTMLNCICGVNRYQVGSVTLGNTMLTGKRSHQIASLGVARTFQAADFFSEFSVRDYVMMGALHSACLSLTKNALYTPRALRSEKDQRERADVLLDQFGLLGEAERKTGVLPYGSRKLLDVLRALLMEPILLLMDEPTSGTTYDDREALRSAIRAIRERGITTLVIDHDVAFIGDTCDRALAMNFGRGLGVGEPGELLSRHEVREAYVGSG